MYRRMLPKPINLIVACQQKGGISYQGQIPWKSPKDLAYFKKVTTTVQDQTKQNAVVMGRKTFDSIGKPLPNRVNYVVSRSLDLNSTGVEYRTSLADALIEATTNSTVEKVFVIGGAEIYNQVLQDWTKSIERTYITTIDTNYDCDRFFSKELVHATHYPGIVIDKVQEDGNTLTFREHRIKNPGEEEYLNVIRRILKDGTVQSNRTGVDTISIFGERMVFDISESIPFITTKRLAWKTMLKELLWFISGDTNNKTLQAQNVHIWDGNSTREYFDHIGLTDREEGDLGPVYGFQWRHFGAEYGTCHDEYTGKGVDQLQNVVELIKNNPESRRIILSAWNPAAQPEMALPPCHVLTQWYVRETDGEKYLDCQMYQRSCDVPLGVPFNIASYSILTYMLAHLAGIKPGRYIQVMGDAHIYTNHVDAVKEQLKRIPYRFPTLRFARKVESIDDFKLEDFIVEDYQCHKTIKMDMVV